ncbi:MAG: hypothetical protein ABIK07_22035 [Planctomycetota bacterium]
MIKNSSKINLCLLFAGVLSADYGNKNKAVSKLFWDHLVLHPCNKTEALIKKRLTLNWGSRFLIHFKLTSEASIRSLLERASKSFSFSFRRLSQTGFIAVLQWCFIIWRRIFSRSSRTACSQ